MDIPESLLAIFAHPDDETFAIGGLLAMMSKGGARVGVVSATRGDKGKQHLKREVSREEIGDMREQEMRSAGEILGVSMTAVFRYPDGDLEHQAGEEVVDALLLIIENFKPEAIVTFAPDGLNGHHDHVAIHEFAMQAFSRAQDMQNPPRTAYWRMLPSGIREDFLDYIEKNRAKTSGHYREVLPEWSMREECVIRLDVADVIDTKERATREHRSQNPEGLLTLPEGIKEKFWTTEWYYKFENNLISE